MHMHDIIKKITITHIYGFKLYSLSLSLSLSLSYFVLFILLSFGYTHEFTLSFLFFLIFFYNLLILDPSSFEPY